MPVLAIIGAVTQIGATVATTVAQVKDVQKRRDYETALNRLSYDDQKILNEKMAKASSQNERLAILVQEINKSSIASMQEESRRDTLNAVIIIGGSLVFLFAIVFLTKKSNPNG